MVDVMKHKHGSKDKKKLARKQKKEQRENA